MDGVRRRVAPDDDLGNATPIDATPRSCIVEDRFAEHESIGIATSSVEKLDGIGGVMLSIRVQLQGVGEAPLRRRSVTVPKRGAAAAIDGKMQQLDRRKLGRQAVQDLSCLTTASVVDNEAGHAKITEPGDDIFDGVLVIEDRYHHARLHAVPSALEQYPAGREHMAVTPEPETQSRSGRRELDTQVEDV